MPETSQRQKYTAGVMRAAEEIGKSIIEMGLLVHVPALADIISRETAEDRRELAEALKAAAENMLMDGWAVSTRPQLRIAYERARAALEKEKAGL